MKTISIVPLYDVLAHPTQCVDGADKCPQFNYITGACKIFHTHTNRHTVMVE